MKDIAKIIILILNVLALTYYNLSAQICNPISILNQTFGNNPNGMFPPTASTTYTQAANGAVPVDGQYEIVNQVPNNNGAWHLGFDNTSNNGNGSMLLFNASATAGNFYTETLNLCAGGVYNFSASIANVLDPASGINNPSRPNISFTVLDGNSNAQLALINTGNIMETPVFQWNQFNLNFTSTGTSVNIVLANANSGGNGNPGNDFALDDIIVTPVCPSFTMSTYCLNQTTGIALSVASLEGIAGTWTLNGNNVTSVNTSLAGTFTYIFTPNNGCNPTVSYTITVNPLPTITVSSNPICPPKSTTLTATGATSFTWNTGATGSSITVSPSSTTTYIVTGSPGNCTKTATVTIDPACASCNNICNNCNWTLNGQGNTAFLNPVNAAPRGRINLTPNCGIDNFIGTRADNPSPTLQTSDLVFGTNSRGWMRLTTQGGLFLTDLPDLNPNLQINPGFTFAAGGNNNSWGNIKIGLYAGNSINSAFGRDNIFLGHNAGFNSGSGGFLNSGNSNIMIGENAGRNVASNASQHIFIGQNAGFNCNANTGVLGPNLIIGSYNYSVANPAPNLSGSRNAFLGHSSGSATTDGYDNTFVGNTAGAINTNGYANTYVGSSSGNVVAFAASAKNTIIGSYSAVGSPTTLIDGNNTFVGHMAGLGVNTGRNNIIIGARANSLSANAAMLDNIFIGNNAGLGATGNQNVAIGNRNTSSQSYAGDNTIIGYETALNGAGSTKNVILGNNTAIMSNVTTNPMLGSVAIGTDFRINGGNNNIAIMAGGNNNFPDYPASGVPNGYIRIGRQMFPGGGTPPSPYDLGVAIGNDAIIIGTRNQQPLRSFANSVNIGYNARANSLSGIAIGDNASCGGSNTTENQANNIAIGTNASIPYNATNSINSVAFGANAIASTSNRMALGAGAPYTTPTVFTGTPLNVGIGIQNATTRLHVNCNDNTGNVIPTGRSGVRFQDLQLSPCQQAPVPNAPSYSVYNLVIGEDGYVYKDALACPTLTWPGPGSRTANIDSITSITNAKADSLQKQIDELKAIIATMAKDVDKCCTKTGSNPIQDFPISKEIKLYQNVPNPFTVGTEIKFFVPETVKVASLIIYDLNGREIRKIDINERNESAIKIQGKELAAGMYIYSLIADSKEVDSKRMILTGN